jgi:fumarate reductase subunit C
MAQSRTPTLAARPPDGFFLQHPRYRLYVAFASTGVVLAAVGVLLLFALSALGSGHQTWAQLMNALASPPMLALNGMLLLGTLFFSLRWLRVGAKIPAVPLGPLPAPAVWLVMIGHFAGLATLSAVILLLLSGLIV